VLTDVYASAQTSDLVIRGSGRASRGATTPFRYGKPITLAPEAYRVLGESICASQPVYFFVALNALALLKKRASEPVFVRFAFRTALPPPQRVRAFAKALMLRLMPEVVGTLFRPALPPHSAYPRSLKRSCCA
jgi:hypothetical protein